MDFERAVSPGALVDGAVIERTAVEVTGFHFGSSSGWGRGVIACAVCGVLWPPAMLVGAIAGGVGSDVMTEVRCGLSGDLVRELGSVLEVGPFVAVAVTYLTAAQRYDLDRPSPGGASSLRASRLNLRATLAPAGVGQMLGDALAAVASERPQRTRWRRRRWCDQLGGPAGLAGPFLAAGRPVVGGETPPDRGSRLAAWDSTPPGDPLLGRRRRCRGPHGTHPWPCSPSSG